MSFSNVTPAWALNPALNAAVADYKAGFIGAADVYRRIKDQDELPNSVKENWRRKADDDTATTEDR